MAVGTDPTRPPFDLDALTVGDERLARYEYVQEDGLREGVCIAKPTPDGGMNLLIGETALRIRYQRMMVGDSDRLIRAYTGLVPDESRPQGPLDVNYILPGRVIGARWLRAGENPMPRRTHTARPAANVSDDPRRGARWPRVTLPNAYISEYRHTARDGRRWDMLAATIPKGTTFDGTDLGGWKFSVFADRRTSADKHAGLPVTLSLRPDRPVRLYRGRGETRQTMDADPARLCEAIAGPRPARQSAPTRTLPPIHEAWGDWELDIARAEHYSIPFDPADSTAMSATDTAGMTPIR